ERERRDHSLALARADRGEALGLAGERPAAATRGHRRLARHRDINTSTIYAGPSDDDVLRAVRELPC
ncbi:MAG: hypothetical protein ACOY3Y_10770, partial [Acidobacteriota bacterium]